MRYVRTIISTTRSAMTYVKSGAARRIRRWIAEINEINSARRQRRREEYRSRFAEDFKHDPDDTSRLSNELILAVILSKEQRYEHGVEATETKAENFLAFVSAGSLALMATLFQGEASNLNWVSLVATICFTSAILCISAIKIYKVKRSYWERGEWWKSRNAFLHGNLRFSETVWRSENSWKNVGALEVLAFVSLILSALGFIFLFLALAFATPQSTSPATPSPAPLQQTAAPAPS